MENGNHAKHTSRHCGRGPAIQAVNKENTLINRLDPGYPAGRPSGMTTQKAFTLIELLVVVLIIGILSAIAIPQYQKAVEKAKAMQGLVLLKSVAQAAESYYLANGQYPIKFEDLDIHLPADWNKTDNFYPHPSNPQDSISNGVWSLVMEDSKSAGNSWCLFIGQLSGKYAGTGFGYFTLQSDSNGIPNHQITCQEVIKLGTPFQPAGGFCEKLFNAKYHSSGGMRQYIMP